MQLQPILAAPPPVPEVLVPVASDLVEEATAPV